MKIISHSLLALFAAAAILTQSGCATLKAQAQSQENGSATKSTDTDKDKKLTAGPKDEKEKVSPGKIDEDASAKFIKTKSGLEYRILRKGEKTKPASTDEVTVHYKGWLDDKTIFDSSYRRGEKISFPLNRVVKGWTEGLQLVGKGGMIELKIPSDLGYGKRGAGNVIPPDATLHFIVELYEIK